MNSIDLVMAGSLGLKDSEPADGVRMRRLVRGRSPLYHKVGVQANSTRLSINAVEPVKSNVLQVVVPPAVQPEDYLLHDDRVHKVLGAAGEPGKYRVLQRDGRKTVQSARMIRSTAHGRSALAVLSTISLSDSELSSGGNVNNFRHSQYLDDLTDPDASQSSEADELSSVAQTRRTRASNTVQRHPRSTRNKRSLRKDLSDESSASNNGRSRSGWTSKKAAKRSSRPAWPINKSRVDYDLRDISSDSEHHSGLSLGKRKRTQTESVAPRRSTRTIRATHADFREWGEDDIEEVETKQSVAKSTGAKEVFQRLPTQDVFRRRHCMTCDTCGQTGDSPERGNLIFCQGCTMSYHQSCIGSRSNRDHLVTKVQKDDFVLQCRRCVEFVRLKDASAPRQGRCAVCKEAGTASKPFRSRKTPAQEQKDRENNGGEDPAQLVAPHLINTIENVMFRCQTCFQAFHLHHLQPHQENPLEGTDLAQKASNRFAEYSSTWTCHVCDSRPRPPIPNAERAPIGGLVAWRPTQDADYTSSQTVIEVAEDEKEYLVRWTNMSHYSSRWMPGSWVWGFISPNMRKAFANRNNGRNLPTMRTEDAIPEEWLRIDIIFQVKYSNVVQAQIEEVDIARIKEVSRVFAKFKGLSYEDCVWTNPPDMEETERYEDFRAAYNDYIRGKYIRPPTQKKVVSELQKVRGKTEDQRKALFKSKVILQEQPSNLLDGKLMDYQLEGVNWLLYQWLFQKNAILADEMGLGKTIQVIGFLAALKERHSLWPFLIVVPNATCANWRREIKQWAPHMRVVTYFGSERSRRLTMDHELFGDRDMSLRPMTDLRCHIVVTSYDTASDPACQPFFRRISWQALIVDEGQRLKNDKTILYANLAALKAPFRLLMTGTPLQNNQRELFNLLQFLDKQHNAEKLEAEFENLNQELIRRLHEMIRPYFLRRTKAQVLGFLPPMGQVIVPVTMSALQKELYKNILGRNAQLLKAIMSKRDGNEKSTAISGLRNVLMQLRKCLCHPFVYSLEVEERTVNAAVSHRRLVAASSKLALLDIILPKLRERGHRVLFFSQFLDMLTIMEDFLDGMELSHLRLDGSHSSLEKQKKIDEFNAPDSQIFAMLLSTRAGGVGINLATADTVIILDPDFNPHQDIQAIARAHRIGQKKKVLVLKLMTRDSAEEKILQVGKRKMVLDHVIVDQMESEDTDGNDLESILAYGAEALFNDTANDIVYDNKSVERLLDRSGLKNTPSVDGVASGDQSFSFAKIWQNDSKSMTEMPSMPETDSTDAGVWERILAARTREAEKKRLQREAAMGRGKRTRNVISYEQDPVKAKDDDQDSDTDFAAKSSGTEFEEDAGPLSVDGVWEAADTMEPAAEAMQNGHPTPTSMSPPRPTTISKSNRSQQQQTPVLSSPTSQRFDPAGRRHTVQTTPKAGSHSSISNISDHRLPRSQAETQHHQFYRVQVQPPVTASQGNYSGLPCLACKNNWGPHAVGSCPLKIAGPEYCNLCGLAHFGYARTCPHLRSETQVRFMLEALKSSPEDPDLVRRCREKLSGLKGALVQDKKRKAAIAAQRARETEVISSPVAQIHTNAIVTEVPEPPKASQPPPASSLNPANPYPLPTPQASMPALHSLPTRHP